MFTLEELTHIKAVFVRAGCLDTDLVFKKVEEVRRAAYDVRKEEIIEKNANDRLAWADRRRDK